MTNQRLRLNLLKGSITEDTFKHEIQRIDKATSKRQELLQVVMTYRDALTDIIWPFYAEGNLKKWDEWLDMIRHIKKLEEYVDTCFSTIAVVFGSTAVHEIRSSANIY